MMYKKVYFIGIGGISQSGLALWCLNSNLQVFGSDIVESIVTKDLENNGAKIFYSHNSQNILETLPDVVVYNGAISQTNPEIVEAKKLNITVIERSQFLYLVSTNFKKVVAVCGCHGKTSSVAHLYSITKKLEPTVHNGGVILPENKSFIIGGKDLFITEACEFKESFLHLKPDILITLNIEADHLDYYKNLDNVKLAYLKFALKIKEGGFLIANYDDKNSKELIALKTSLTYKSRDISIITFGFNSRADCYAKNITKAEGRLKFDVYYRRKHIGKVDTPSIGTFHAKNILACICAAMALKVPVDDIFSNIQEGRQVKRRMEKVKSYNDNFIIFHDYAHHPTEIKSVIKATASSFKKSKIYVVFEPHTYTRTQMLEDQFIKCFSKANQVKLLPIYPAREQPIENITSENLAKKIKNASCFQNYEKAKEWIDGLDKSQKAVVLILGAGTIVELAKMLE